MREMMASIGRVNAKVKLARHFAKRNGFASGPGGWVWRLRSSGERESKPVCQGWDRFFVRYERQIVAYFESAGLPARVGDDVRQAFEDARKRVDDAAKAFGLVGVSGVVR